MSDTMLLGALRMPLPDNPDPLTLAQLAGRAREAAERIEHDAAEIARMRSALDWYAEMAKTMQRATLRVDNQVALHILKQMALDGGKRAREALTSNERPVRPCNRS